MITKRLEEVIARIEQMPVSEQDAIAELLQHEINTRHEERRRQIGPIAIDRLADLTADLPLVDALQVANDSRDELAKRHVD